MRFSKKYLVFVLLIMLTLGWKLNNWNDRYAAVEPFRGAALKEEVFYPLMSKNINDVGGLKVYLNGTAYANNDKGVMLDNSLQPAVSIDFIADVMHGGVYRVDDLSTMLQVTDDVYEFLLGNGTAIKNGDDYDLKAIPSEYNSQVYLGLEDLCDIFGYGYEYNPDSREVSLIIDEYPKLPSTYDLRNQNKMSVIRDQGSTSTCWACASLEAMESTLLPYENYLFSVDDMITNNSFGMDESDGGEYTMALAYLLSWQGPKIEESVTESLLSDMQVTDEEHQVHLQEAHFFDSEDLDQIKLAVFRYGGVSTSIYASVSTSNLSETANYNRKTNAYCYRGNNLPNHDVVIIGWDDNYAASNFSEDVPGNGAFICQNSWGDDFGDAGVFYISYYDTNIGDQAVSYVDVDTSMRYSYIYQSDKRGWVGQIGYNKDWAYGANVFTATSTQQIEATGFYALDVDTSYEVYYVKDFKNTSSLSKRELVASGTLDEAGYYTIEFDTPRTVEEGESFAIAVYISTPDTNRPIAIEYKSEDTLSDVDIEDGKGYISSNGLDWENVEEAASANLCIKAYGNKVTEVFE